MVWWTYEVLETLGFCDAVHKKMTALCISRRRVKDGLMDASGKAKNELRSMMDTDAAMLMAKAKRSERSKDTP